MSYHPRIEAPDITNFLTTRCRNSELWFINNKPLDDAILGYLASFTKRYSVKLYAYATEGSHNHSLCLFPDQNRAHFMRDFNSSTARAVKRLCSGFRGGSLFARRYSNEFCPDSPDIEDRFFYTVLQPVQDGLVEKISQYPGYNCFHDAVYGIKRDFYVVDWTRYNSDKRFNPNINVADYRKKVTLVYERLPGYEHLSQREYAKLMHEKLEERRVKIVKERKAAGLGFLGRDVLLGMRAGTPARRPKTSTPTSHRPRVLCVCPVRRLEYKRWYFELYFAYREASRLYRSGVLDTEFPPGMYRPYLPLLAA